MYFKYKNNQINQILINSLPTLHLIQRLFAPRIGSLVSGSTRIKVTG